MCGREGGGGGGGRPKGMGGSEVRGCIDPGFISYF